MADITVRLIFNQETGKKDIWIDYDSDEDALPHEHERRHRRIVEQLLGQRVLEPDELGQVQVSRGGARSQDEEGAASPAPPTAAKQGEG